MRVRWMLKEVKATVTDCGHGTMAKHWSVVLIFNLSRSITSALQHMLFHQLSESFWDSPPLLYHWHPRTQRSWPFQLMAECLPSLLVVVVSSSSTVLIFVSTRVRSVSDASRPSNRCNTLSGQPQKVWDSYPISVMPGGLMTKSLMKPWNPTIWSFLPFFLAYPYTVNSSVTVRTCLKFE